MKLPRQKRDETSATITQTLLLILACSAVCALTAFGAPSWWSTRNAVLAPHVATNSGVVTTNYIQNDYAAVNQGQLKLFTTRAVAELNANLPGGAGTDLNSLVNGWANDYTTNGYNAFNIKPSDYTAMNVGQLKYVGNKVWSQLVAGGYTNSVPSWLAQNTNSDYAIANLGQLKTIFNFDFNSSGTTSNAPQVTSPTTAITAVNTLFSYTITATQSPTSFSATGLPSWLSITAGVISGTPTATGLFNINVFASNASGTGSGVLVIKVISNQSVPAINSPSTDSAIAGSAFAYRITASNSPTRYGATNLPSGLSVDPASGIITGTVASPGTYVITLSASNSSGSGTKSLTLTVNASSSLACEIISATTASALLGQSFSYTIVATNNPTSYGAIGLPPGLSISGAVISGTPTAAGTYQFPITATNAGGTASEILTLQVTTNSPAITSPYTVNWVAGYVFDYFITANNAPTNFAAASLPTGLILNSNTGEISGIPRNVGVFSPTMTATGPFNSASHSLVLTISEPTPVITSPTTASATVGTLFSYQIQATSSPTSYTASGLPEGLSLNPSNGLISGVVNFPGTYSVAISATNSYGNTGNATLTLTAQTPGPQVPFFALPQIVYFTANTACSYQLQVGNSAATTTYSVGTGELPTGVNLSVTSGTATIGGTPTQIGTYFLDLTATNTVGTSNAQLILVVEATTASETVTGQTFQAGINPTSNYATTSATIEEDFANHFSFIANQSYPNELIVGVDPAIDMTRVARGLVGFDLSLLPPDVTIDNASLTLNAQSSASAQDTINLYQAATFFQPDSAAWNVNNGIVNDGSNVPILLSSWSGSSQAVWSSSDNFKTAVLNSVQEDTPLDLMLVDPTAEANAVTGADPNNYGSYSFSTETDVTNYGGTLSPSPNRPVLALTYETASPPIIALGQVFQTGDYNFGNVDWVQFQVQCLLQNNGGNFAVDTTKGDPLPSGWTLDANTGMIQGDPDEDGVCHCVITCTNHNGTGSMPITIYVEGNAPVFSLLTSGTTGTSWGFIDATPTEYDYDNILMVTTVGSEFSFTPTFAGDGIISLTASGLPPGLSMDPVTGTISGTIQSPVSWTPITVTVRATNAVGSGFYSFTLTITPPTPVIAGPVSFSGNAHLPLSGCSIAALNLDDSSLQNGIVTTGAGDEPPPSWLTVTYNPTTQAINLSGTPPASGTYEFKVKATNGYFSSDWTPITINVADTPTLQINTTAINGFVGQPLSSSINYSWSPAIGANSSTSVTWSPISLPFSLTLDSNAGTVSGTPGTTGTSSVTLTGTYGDSSQFSVSQTVAVSVTAGPAITSPLTAMGSVGVLFDYPLTASGFASGTGATNMPSELSYTPNPTNSASGDIKGVPAASSVGTHSITLSAWDASGNTNSATLQLTINAITSSLTASGQVGVPFSYPISASGSPTGYGASDLPAGLSITNGTISGTPLVAGIFQVPLTTTYPQTTAQATLTLTISAASSDSSLSFQQGVSPTVSYSAPSVMVQMDSGNSSVASNTFNTGSVLVVGATSTTAVSRALLNFNLSAIPANATITSVNLVMNASSSNSSGAQLPVEVHQASASFDPTLANWVTNNSYEGVLLASSTLNPSTTSGANTFYGTTDFTAFAQQAYQNGVPLNLVLLSPTAERASPGAVDYIGFTTRATDPTQNPELIVTYTLGAPTAAPVITSSGTALGIVGQPFTYNITALNRPTSYGINSGDVLPSGLTLTTGVISGTPSQVGSTTVHVNATNGIGTGTKSVTFNIDSATSATSLTYVDGTHQVGMPGATLSNALKVYASTASGPLANALVTFAVLPGQGKLITATTPPIIAQTVSVVTHDDGVACAYFQLPPSFGAYTVMASAGTATPVTFVENAWPTLPTGQTSDGGQGSDLPILSVISGQNQSGPVNSVVSFVVQAVNRLGLPISSLPLSLYVNSGGGTISSSTSISTGSNGQAVIYLTLGGSNNGVNKVACKAASVYGETPTVYLNALATTTTPGLPNPGGSAGTLSTDTDPAPPAPPNSNEALTFTVNPDDQIPIPGYNGGPGDPEGGAEVTLPDPTDILISAQNIPGATYILQRSLNGLPWVNIQSGSWSTDGQDTICEDSNLQAGNRYLYQLIVAMGDAAPQVIASGEHDVPPYLTMIEYDYDENGNPTQTGQIGDGNIYDWYLPIVWGGWEYVFNPSTGNQYRWVMASYDFEDPTPFPNNISSYGTIVSTNTPGNSQVYMIGAYNGPQAYWWPPGGPDGESVGPIASFDPCSAIGPSSVEDGGAVFSVVPDANNQTSISWSTTTWSTNPSFEVYDQWGNLANPYLNIVLGDWDPSNPQGATYTVVPTSTAEPGDTIEFTSHYTEGTDYFSYTYTGENKNSSISIDESAGPKYRKIALNGLPMADEKPQAADETDQEKEESYVDALMLGVRHSTTDVYMPVSGSELAVQARRDFRSEAWSYGSGLRPHERPTQPFGPCWSSNLGANIEFIKDANPLKTSPDQAIVTDETGGVHTFVMYNGTNGVKFFPMPSAKNEQQAPNLETLTIDTSGPVYHYIFSRKYGTTLTFELTTVTQTPHENRAQAGTYFVQHSYARLTQAVDRIGNTVLYQYVNATNLIPSTISVAGQPQTVLSIEQVTQSIGSDHLDPQPRITAIWDANHNKTTYHYTQILEGTYASTAHYAYFLDSVTAPDGAVTGYTYELDTEPDQAPHPNAPQNFFGHADLASITDPNSKTYTFSYADASGNPVFDHSKLANINGAYYPECGLPRNVTKIIMPDGTFSTFTNNSTIKIVGANPGNLVGQRQNTVVDANGFTHTYRFINPQIFQLPKLKVEFNSPGMNGTNVICYKSTVIDYGVAGTSGYIGSEQFNFDPNAGMALSQITDLSGNTTSFAHADLWNTGAAYTEYTDIIANPASIQFNGAYNDPTTQTDALNNTKTFTYDTDSRIMTSVTTSRPSPSDSTYATTTTYQLDSLKRRVQETISDSHSNVAQITKWTYDSTYPGFIDCKTVVGGLSGDSSGAPSLVTKYIPDSNGRVAQEIVDPNGLHLVTSYTYDANGNKLSATDPRNNTTWFSYDIRNRLTTVTYADGTQKQMVYDARGNKITEYDENGIATLYQYDQLNRLTDQIRDMNGNGANDGRGTDLVTSYGYNAVNSKTSVTDPNGYVTTMAYDNLQRVTQITDALNNSTSFVYGANSGGNAFDSSSFKPTQTTDPRGYVTTVQYDPLYHARIKQVQYDTSGDLSTTSSVYDAVGNLVSFTDAASSPNTTTTAYDALNRPTLTTYADGSTTQVSYTSTGLKWQVKDPDNNVTQSQFDGAGRPIVLTQPSVVDGTTSSSAHPVTKTIYDPAGNVAATINPRAQEGDNVYDARNRLIEAISPPVLDAASGNTVRACVVTDYDAAGNVVAKTDPRGNATTMQYDPANRVTDVYSPAVAHGTPHVHTTYDANGNATYVTADVLTAGGNTTSQTTHNLYDGLNRLYTTTDAANITVTNYYDQVGNKHLVGDGLYHYTTFNYDGLNRNTSVVDALGKSTQFKYDGQNKTQRLDADGQTTTYLYDNRNRLHQVAYNSGSSANSPRSYAYDANGNLLCVTEPAKTSAKVQYTYDALNRALTEQSQGLTHTYSYDLAGNRVGTVYGGTSRAIASTYDNVNRLSSMTEAGTRTTGYDYDLNGNIAHKTAPNGDTETYTYDAVNRAIDEKITEGSPTGALMSEFQYDYDLLGNVLTVDEQYPSLTGRLVTNTYDNANRLLVEAVTGTVDVTTTYGYDNANNRASMVIAGGSSAGTTTYSYDDANELTGYTDSTGRSVALGYDSNGNRTSRTVSGGSDNGTDTYSYDFENRLIGLVKGTAGNTGTYSYTYDYRTRRIVRDESSAGGATTAIVFSGGTSVQEYDNGASSPTVENIRGSDYGGGVGGILYTLRTVSGTLTPSYTHENKRGDVVLKTDGSGTATYQAQYQAFGQQVATSGATLDRQKSNSKDTDPTGLVDEGHRYRDLETGMFITRDPAGFVDGPNLYTYVVQNPWTSFDPEGLEAMSSDEPSNDQIQGKINDLDTQSKAADKAVDEDRRRASYGDAMPSKSLEDTAKSLHEQKDFLVKILEVRERLGDNGYGEWSTDSEIAKTFGQGYGDNVRSFFKPASGWFVPESEQKSLDAYVAISKLYLSAPTLAINPLGALGGSAAATQMAAKMTGLIGVTDREAAALARQMMGIKVDGQSAVSSVEAFGSRAGSTFRGRGPTATSDLDLFITLDSKVVTSPQAMRSVQGQISDVGDLWQSVKGYPLQPMTELDTIAPQVKLQLQQTPFVPMGGE